MALTHNSGALVPNPIITIPMMKGEMPSVRATSDAPSTKMSLDQDSATSPPTTKTIESQTGISEYILCIIPYERTLVQNPWKIVKQRKIVEPGRDDRGA